MRISDWSSDVCSSDLDDPAAPLKLAIIGRPNAGKSTLINRLLGQERLITGPEAGITRDSITIDRSEEHTSELQSLMRISYAVFCLKKKNKKLHDTYSQQHIKSTDYKYI